MSGPFRLPTGGEIDRSRRLTFRFDGLAYEGHPGDTLASALLANGQSLVGRSFKYHRPRGIVTAGFEEPCALVDVGVGAHREPNTRATVQPLYDGLVAESQNRWPSLRFDLAAINGRIGRFLPAGFYYKTFMWPASFWEKLYEPAIRRAAGLGTASTEPDPDHYEHAHAHCDVLVVGAGAAGLAAADAAARAGARVILADMDAKLGGGLRLDPERGPWLEAMLGRLGGYPELDVMPLTTVVGYYEHNVLAAVEVVDATHGARHGARQRLWTIRAREVVLATGAGERLIAFPDNDRPGVMLASAALAFARRHGVAVGREVVLFTNNDEAYGAAFALKDAGVAIRAIVDPRPDALAMEAAQSRGIEVWRGSEVLGVRGRRRVTGVEVQRRNSGSNILSADALLVSGGCNPRLELASMSGARAIWSEPIAAFVPGAPVQRERSVGAARGTFGYAAAASDGAQAGAAAASALGFEAKAAAHALPALPPDPASTPVLPLWEVSAKGKSFVDLQHDVTAEDIRLAHREGYSHVEHAKRYTTLAMATDQGRIGALVGAAILAEARGEPVERVGLPNHRPYTVPVTWGAFVGPSRGPHFQPARRTPLHDWHRCNHAVFMNAGAWIRPAYYSAEKETGWAPILREARAVRQSVGLCDVSTLGKIDIQGADAALLLDRVYTNTFSTLPVGKSRYGLMLREDGIAFDDGTTSRLSTDHFLMTTTTARADDVLEHMEYLLQVVWPELDVVLTNVTDFWAQMSIAGPRARAVLEAAVSGLDLRNEALPFMGVGEGAVGGQPVRVYRVSFSGELAYEVATPAAHGEAVWSALMEAGRQHAIVPYGLEALGLLRVEKGHAAGPELNGHTTARDLGMERLLKKKGDFVGRVNGERAGLIAADRPHLVGIRAVDPSFERRLRGGAHIVADHQSTESLGWVTSVTRSVELERWVGLAMVRNGEARMGKRLYAVFPLKREAIEVEITSPHHVDPENLRVRS